MATEDRKDAELEGSKEGEALDKILEHIGGVHERLDKMEKRMDAYEGKKADSEKEEEHEERDDKHRKDAKKDGEGKEALKEEREENELKENDKGKKDARKDGEEKDDKKDAKKDDAKEEEHKDRKDAKKDEDEERDDSRADSATVKTLRRELDALAKRVPVELSDEDHQKFVDAQARADSVAQAFGKHAPRWLSGESLNAYRKRLLRSYQPHSKAWKDTDLSAIHDSAALSNIETMVYADARNAALNPIGDEADTLRPVIEKDRTGREITKFYGSPEACWGSFKQPVRVVTGITKKFD